MAEYNENGVRRRFSDFTISKRIKLALGIFAISAMPTLAARPARNVFGEGSDRLGSLVRNGLLGQAFLRRDHSRLRRLLSAYWGEYASKFHDDWDDRFKRIFLGRDLEVLTLLDAWIAEKADVGAPVEHLYEIGCGGGRLLAFLAERYPALSELNGVDLGSSRIEMNNTIYADPRLQFHAADAVKWIPEHAKPGSIFLTNGGVFEYFLEEELRHLFRWVASLKEPCAILLIETIGTDHDLATERQSLVYGREMAFSHNYPHLLGEAGFTIRHCSEAVGYEEDGGGRWIRIFATTASLEDTHD
jgi:SAM-dependent methyltransferase